MKQTIKDIDINNKTLIIRSDLNVPIRNGIITDDTRIIKSLETIKYALERNCKIVILSHLGRIKNEEDKKIHSLKIVANYINNLLGNVTFVEKNTGEHVVEVVKNMKNKDILLLENTRHCDFPEKRESTNESTLGEFWASLGDIFINDAFGTSHRVHASNVGIANSIPSAIGLLMEKEINTISEKINKPERPFSLIMGGAKIKDKTKVINNLIEKVDHIFICGGMSYTFLKAKGLEIGKSILDEDNINYCKDLMKKYPNKIILPIDNVVTEEFKDTNNFKIVDSNNILDNQMGMDIGPETIKLFKEYLVESKLIIMNGPAGVFEFSNFIKGTVGLCDILSTSKAFTIIGGGDSVAATKQFGYYDSISHISTGGGAMLALLQGEDLPALNVIKEK